MANAQHEGYLESEPAFYSVFVPGIYHTPTPEIFCDYDGYNGQLYVIGEGELTVSINGVEIPDFTSPYIIQAKLGEDQEFEIMATAQLEGYLESMPAYYWVHLDGIWVQAQPPTFDFTWTDESVIVTVEGEGDILITMGENTFYYDGPIVLPKGEVDYEVTIMAVAEMSGYLPSDVVSYTLHIEALPEAQAPSP